MLKILNKIWENFEKKVHKTSIILKKNWASYYILFFLFWEKEDFRIFLKKNWKNVKNHSMLLREKFLINYENICV